MKIAKEIFDKYEINPGWFKRNPFSIHGILHEYRVLVYSYLIGSSEGANIDVLCNAARFHDVRRYNDGFDVGHAKRASSWVKKNFNLDNLKEIIYLIKWHTPSDSQAPEMTLELKCFKDADALDRWRIGDLDPNYLRTKTAKRLLDFSKQFYDLTEGQKKIINPKENIISILDNLNILNNK